MMTSRIALLAGVIALGVAGVATAQGRGTQTVEVPAGSVVLVVPAGMIPVMSMPRPAFASVFDDDFEPIAMMRQMDAMMANARQMMTAAETMPSGGMSGVMVSSFSDGRGTCTRRVTYNGNAAPLVQVSGDGCGADGTPAALPTPRIQPAHTLPHTLEVRNRVRPIEVASAR